MNRDYPIERVASELGVSHEHLSLRGRDCAKLELGLLDTPQAGRGQLVLISAITPTKAGEGKTTTAIGLAQGLRKRGQKTCLALREPSLGPVFGLKGGGIGTGVSQLVPGDRINLHLTGDMHAITAAHNLLAALLDNHLHYRREPTIDPRRVSWPRVIDMNDRALRNVIVGLGGPTEGIPREASFHITPASELMASLCLAEGPYDLRARIDRTILGWTMDGKPVTVAALHATDSVMSLMYDALLPNLVRTTEGGPAIVHGGPFANIAHGCSSVLATRMAMHSADWAVTEAGFGTDLGAEKFFDIKCTTAGLDVACSVLVVTVRALAQNGFHNLERHLDNLGCFGPPIVVALNRFPDDTEADIHAVRQTCARRGVPFATSDHVVHGGDGALALADAVIETAKVTPVRPLYQATASLEQKVEVVARTMYGTTRIVWSAAASRDLKRLKKHGFDGLPICVAKQPTELPEKLTIAGLDVSAGAGFVVVRTGDIRLMPGLPRSPRSVQFSVDDLKTA